MQVNILTIFPDYFVSPLQTSILKRAQTKDAIEVNVVDIRDFASDKHHTTDDRPFGGGPGMVMKLAPIEQALRSLNLGLGQPRTASSKVVLLSARGKKIDQSKVRELAKLEKLTLICGHYADVDQRVADHLIDEELSIGDYVLTGGEPAALVIVDAVARLLPAVLGNEQSVVGETHDTPGFCSPPQYTRPEVYQDLTVPEALLSGDPKKIKQWQSQWLEQQKFVENR